MQQERSQDMVAKGVEKTLLQYLNGEVSDAKVEAVSHLANAITRADVAGYHDGAERLTQMFESLLNDTVTPQDARRMATEVNKAVSARQRRPVGFAHYLRRR